MWYGIELSVSVIHFSPSVSNMEAALCDSLYCQLVTSWVQRCIMLLYRSRVFVTGIADIDGWAGRGIGIMADSN